MATMTQWNFGKRTTSKTLIQGKVSHGYNASGANQAFTLALIEEVEEGPNKHIVLTMSRAECESAITNLQKYLKEYP